MRKVITLQILYCHCPTPCIHWKEAMVQDSPGYFTSYLMFNSIQKHCPCSNDKQWSAGHSASCLFQQCPAAELLADLPAGGSCVIYSVSLGKPWNPFAPEMGAAKGHLCCLQTETILKIAQRRWCWQRTLGWVKGFQEARCKETKFPLIISRESYSGMCYREICWQCITVPC